MLAEYVYLNGRFELRHKAFLSIDDSGFLYGFGCYDTLLVLNQVPLFIEEHLERLNHSLALLKILKQGFTIDELRELIVTLVKKNEQINSRIRITVTRGEMDLNRVHEKNSAMTILISSRKLPDDYFNRTVTPFRLMISQYIRNHPFSIPPSLKLTSLANHLFASMEAKENGFDDALMVSYHGYLAEGSSFNLFFVKEGKIYTPHLNNGILPGITRQVLLTLFDNLGLAYSEGYFKPQDLYNSDEAFATSSVRGIVPIIELDGHSIPLGPLTITITQKYYALLRSLSQTS